MKLVSREMVEKAGVNVDELLDLLVRNAAAELTTFYYYTILRVNLIGMEGEGLKEITEDARIEDRNHFEALVPRIYELGGKLPDNMKDFHDLSACPPAKLPKNLKDITAIVKVLLKAEQCAVRGYTHVCNITAGKDHRTYELALAILMRKSSTRRGSQSSWVRGRRVTSAAAPWASRPSSRSSCIRSILPHGEDGPGRQVPARLRHESHRRPAHESIAARKPRWRYTVNRFWKGDKLDVSGASQTAVDR